MARRQTLFPLHISNHHHPFSKMYKMSSRQQMRALGQRRQQERSPRVRRATLLVAKNRSKRGTGQGQGSLLPPVQSPRSLEKSARSSPPGRPDRGHNDVATNAEAYTTGKTTGGSRTDPCVGVDNDIVPGPGPGVGSGHRARSAHAHASGTSALVAEAPSTLKAEQQPLVGEDDHRLSYRLAGHLPVSPGGSDSSCHRETDGAFWRDEFVGERAGRGNGDGDWGGDSGCDGNADGTGGNGGSAWGGASGMGDIDGTGRDNNAVRESLAGDETAIHTTTSHCTGDSRPSLLVPDPPTNTSCAAVTGLTAASLPAVEEAELPVVVHRSRLNMDVQAGEEEEVGVNADTHHDPYARLRIEGGGVEVGAVAVDAVVDRMPVTRRRRRPQAPKRETAAHTANVGIRRDQDHHRMMGELRSFACVPSTVEFRQRRDIERSEAKFGRTSARVTAGNNANPPSAARWGMTRHPRTRSPRRLQALGGVHAKSPPEKTTAADDESSSSCGSSGDEDDGVHVYHHSFGIVVTGHHVGVVNNG